MKKDRWSETYTITIDGGAKLGSGTIVRYSVAVASLLGKETKIENIRQQSDKPASI